MSFYTHLQSATARERSALLARPIIADCMAGRVSLESYVAFLCQAYHHVKHTVPLLMACGARLPARLGWLQAGLVEYIAEEHGHEQWILNDIAACGVDPEAVAASLPQAPTEVMVSFVYDMINRVNPVGFFGMVYVLEGTSVAIATQAADIIQRSLGLPAKAFSYLRSHGAVDQKHIGDYERLVNRLDDAHDRQAVIHTARMVFDLYGRVFDSLPRASAHSNSNIAKEVA